MKIVLLKCLGRLPDTSFLKFWNKHKLSEKLKVQCPHFSLELFGSVLLTFSEFFHVWLLRIFSYITKFNHQVRKLTLCLALYSPELIHASSVVPTVPLVKNDPIEWLVAFNCHLPLASFALKCFFSLDSHNLDAFENKRPIILKEYSFI